MLELRTNSGLIFADFIEIFLYRSQCFLVFQQLFQGNSRFLHLVVNLQDGQVVGFSEQEGHRLEQLCIALAKVAIFADFIGQNECVAQLCGLVGTEGHVLQPHHRAEVVAERVGAGVVASRTEERVGEFGRLIVEKFRKIVFRALNFADFIENLLFILRVGNLRSLTRDECLGNGEIGLVPVAGACLHRLAELFQGLPKPVLLHFAHHAVEIEVEKLQIEVGGDKRRKVAVVVLLIDVEKLHLPPGNDGEAVFAERLFEFRVDFL